MKGVVPKALIRSLLEYAETNDVAEKFYSIHSLKVGEIGRLMMDCSTPHLEQLVENAEDDVFLGHRSAESNVLSKWFKTICVGASSTLGLKIRDICETEIIKNEPFSAGQSEHMDALSGTWNYFSPLVDSPGTSLKQQVYQDYPENVGPSSTVPMGWSELENVHIPWEVGDLLLVRSNAIHSGPANGSQRRYVIFAAEVSPQSDEHSDTLVVTEDVFFAKKRAAARAVKAANMYLLPPPFCSSLSQPNIHATHCHRC